VTKPRERLRSGGTSGSRLPNVGGVGFGVFGERGFISAGGRGMAELVTLSALKGDGFRGLRLLALMVVAV
jgi:hypothetical protein